MICDIVTVQQKKTHQFLRESHFFFSKRNVFLLASYRGFGGAFVSPLSGREFFLPSHGTAPPALLVLPGGCGAPLPAVTPPSLLGWRAACFYTAGPARVHVQFLSICTPLLLATPCGPVSEGLAPSY